ncbi:diacylglycerol kinase family lipid kinase, partial [[Ruminococcus] lactaris]
LNSEKIEKLDVGELVLGGKRRRFLVSAGMGFDAAVCHEVCISKWKKILNRLKLGKLSYAVVALNRLLKDQPVRMEIRLDDGSVHRFERAYFAAFMNQKYEGGGFKFCPEASPSDGKLDIMVAADLSKKKILCLLPTAFFGKHTKFRGVTILQCRSAEVSTGSTLPIHTDGEPIFLRNEMKVRLMEEKIRFITE